LCKKIYSEIFHAGTQSRYTVIESNGISLLRIEPVRAGRDDAPYECIAENGVGDAVSAEATLTVYETDKTPSGFPAIEVSTKRKG
jgi:receptor-type tyrosine-protein phosphatase F